MGRLRIENTTDDELSVDGYVKVVDELITDANNLEDFTDANPKKRVTQLLNYLKDAAGSPIAKVTIKDRAGRERPASIANCRIRIQREDRGRKTLVALPLAELHIANTTDTDTKDFEYLNSYITTLLDELDNTGAFDGPFPKLKAPPTPPTKGELIKLERVRKFLFGTMMFTRCR